MLRPPKGIDEHEEGDRVAGQAGRGRGATEEVYRIPVRARTAVRQLADEQSNYQAVASATRAIFPLRFSVRPEGSQKFQYAHSPAVRPRARARAAMRITAAPKNTENTASLI